MLRGRRICHTQEYTMRCILKTLAAIDSKFITAKSSEHEEKDWSRARRTTQQSHHHQTSKNAPRIQSYTTQKGMYQCGVSA